MNNITWAIIPVSRFYHAKTRLSPTLTSIERENLLKSMLKDVIASLREAVDQVVVISSDDDVLDYVEKLEVLTIKEKGKTDLNGALSQAIDICWEKCDKILITPSDIPLIKKAHIEDMLKMGEKFDMVIAPSKGGGTNAILFSTRDMKTRFGDYSFFQHLKEAQSLNRTTGIYDSFYLSMDVNTAEDLGEIILHGRGTETQKYLKSLPLKIRSNHGSERLEVKRVE
ncbi:MAG: 2-phospho-L-lactate guanylyltransferase [Methanobacteriaceae archaeon]|nr:2-phospho-L-lactate guanylyltransferase [Methanobacteriaceae archaeon]